ncbi:MAG: SCO family protein [Gammaproteobacteria bacterium]|nr:SCO family protein [Gammaproteobacteria bacterium]
MLLAGMLAIFAGNRASAHSDDETPAANYLSGGDFTLNSPDGLLSLSDLRGKVVLVFFGYTSCPDVCPLSLARINAGFRTMGDEELERVRALFITLDPERDTNERLRKYVGYFHPNIIGLRDDVEGIKNVAKNFGVEFSRKVVPNSALGYSISHPTDILLLDRQGRFVKAVPHNIEVGRLVALIRGLLNAND